MTALRTLHDYAALDFQLAINDLCGLEDRAGEFLSDKTKNLFDICMIALAHVANQLTEGTIGDNGKGGN